MNMKAGELKPRHLKIIRVLHGRGYEWSVRGFLFVHTRRTCLDSLWQMTGVWYIEKAVLELKAAGLVAFGRDSRQNWPAGASLTRKGLKLAKSLEQQT